MGLGLPETSVNGVHDTIEFGGMNGGEGSAGQTLPARYNQERLGRGMQIPFQVDRFHINNLQAQGVLGDRYSGFSLEDQQPVVCLLINDQLMSVEQLEELKRVNIILAQK